MPPCVSASSRRTAWRAAALRAVASERDNVIAPASICRAASAMASAAAVGAMSRLETTRLSTCPALIRPGMAMMNGTRTPPSR